MLMKESFSQLVDITFKIFQPQVFVLIGLTLKIKS